jgi:hypothetical protein
MSRFRPYTPKRPEGRFKYVPGLAGFEAMVHAVVCHQVAGARLAPARATPTWPGSRLDDRTIHCGNVEGRAAPRVAGGSSVVPGLRGRRGDRVHSWLFRRGVPGVGWNPAGRCSTSALRGTGSVVPRPGLIPAPAYQAESDVGARAWPGADRPVRHGAAVSPVGQWNARTNSGHGPVARDSSRALADKLNLRRVYVRNPVSDNKQGFVTGVAELLTGDDGTVAWADLQYVVFTLITLVNFVALFLARPTDGLPSVPAALLTLMGVSATTYAANKIVNTRGATPNGPAADQ